MVFSIHSFKVCAHIYAININSDASNRCIFRKRIRKSLVQGFKDSLTQQTNLLSYNLKQEFTKSREKTDPESLDDAIKNSIQKFASDRKKDIQEVSVFDSNRKLMAISDTATK